MNSDYSLEDLKQSWIRAANELGFAIVFAENKPIGKTPVEYFAFLPEFGSAGGIFLGLYQRGHDVLTSELEVWCRTTNLRCAFINPKSYSEFNRKFFIDTLLDWGFFGENLPVWASKRYIPWS